MAFHHWVEASGVVAATTGFQISGEYGISQVNLLRAQGIDIPTNGGLDYVWEHKNYFGDWGPTEYGALAGTIQLASLTAVAMAVIAFAGLTFGGGSTKKKV